MSSFIISAVLLMIVPTIAVAADPFHHLYGWEHPRLDPGSNDPYDTSNNNKEQNQIDPVEITEENSKIQNLIGSSMAIGVLPTDSKYSVNVRPWEDPMPTPGGPKPTSESNDIDNFESHTENLVNVRPWEDPMPTPGGPKPTSESNDIDTDTDSKSEHLADLRPWGPPMPLPGPHKPPNKVFESDAIVVTEASGGEQSTDNIITPKAQEVQFFHPDYYPHPSLLK